MIVGITGHQHREGIDWTWVQTEMLAVMEKLQPAAAIGSLAAGSDQLFAAVALQVHSKLISVLPFEGYGELFQGDARRMFRFLSGASEIRRLMLRLPQEEAFLEAGKYIVDHCDLLLTVWDGKPAEGLGGTADIVAYARAKGRSIARLEPITRTVRTEGSVT